MKNLDLISKLNWSSDDGINLPMINDVVRNAFYNNILERTVANRHCSDIGFGTGLLSMLAIKHGAKFITAYEKNPYRYELGLHIINKLNLTNKIKLINETATSEHIQDAEFDLVFHEIVHQRIWGEGLWLLRPKNFNREYAPGISFLEIHASEISDYTIDGLVNSADSEECFNPGIDISSDFIDIVNNIISDSNKISLHKNRFNDTIFRTNWNSIHKDWSWNPIQVFSQVKKSLVASYHVDFSNRELNKYDINGTQSHDNFDTNFIELEIDSSNWTQKNIMLELRFGLKNRNETLYLDHCRSWGQEAPWLVVKPKANIKFSQNLVYGDISLEFC